MSKTEKEKAYNVLCRFLHESGKLLMTIMIIATAILFFVGKLDKSDALLFIITGYVILNNCKIAELDQKLDEIVFEDEDEE